MHGALGFPLLAILKLFRCDFPNSDKFLVPCFWRDMQVPAESLSAAARSHIDDIHAAIPSSDGSWETHFFRRPHQAAMIADLGGAIFFAPGCCFTLLHAFARAPSGFVASSTYVGSFRHNGHTVTTTDNLRGFDAVPGSICHMRTGSPSDLIRHHRTVTTSITDIAAFASFSDFVEAYDRKEKLQAEWDFARGAFVSAVPT